MEIPLLKPALPQNKVSCVAVSDHCDALISKLNELNIEQIITEKNNSVKDIDYHTDLFLLNIGNNELILDKSQSSNIVKYLTKGYRCKILQKEVSSPYPGDCLLNSAIFGNIAIYNPDSTDNAVIAKLKSKGYRLVETNQGYAKCSVCPVSDNALITDDESIYNSCKKNSIDALLISKGSIKLKGFNYGFIGGCTGRIDKNKLLFNGDINYHTDCNKILDFLYKYKTEPVIIENRPLTDVGSIVPLCEIIEK